MYDVIPVSGGRCYGRYRAMTAEQMRTARTSGGILHRSAACVQPAGQGRNKSPDLQHGHGGKDVPHGEVLPHQRIHRNGVIQRHGEEHGALCFVQRFQRLSGAVAVCHRRACDVRGRLLPACRRFRHGGDVSGLFRCAPHRAVGAVPPRPRVTGGHGAGLDFVPPQGVIIRLGTLFGAGQPNPVDIVAVQERIRVQNVPCAQYHGRAVP